MARNGDGPKDLIYFSSRPLMPKEGTWAVLDKSVEQADPIIDLSGRRVDLFFALVDAVAFSRLPAYIKEDSGRKVTGKIPGCK
jgi:hypothetical protein